uniref:Sulfotransferase domain-containing protein n=1 Tax=Alexandrium monilatum TaxID=311494 RepID=A0A7S4R438_9DINO
MPYEAMARYRSAVMLPWDLNLVMFHDLYAMELPLHLPDRAGLHHTAFAYFARFRRTSEFAEQPWSEVRPGRSADSPHPYSPFALEHLEPRDYWLGFTEYLRAPHVLRFAGLPELLLQVLRLDGPAVAAGMRRHNLRCRREARDFWGRALAALGRGGPAPRPLRGRAPVLHFAASYRRDLCWRGGLSRAACCGGLSACFDDFWTHQRCCVDSLRLPSLDDAACRRPASDALRSARGPAGGPWESPLDGRPFVQEEPSAREPFVFLWDEKCGGTTFMTWLKYSVWRLGKLRSSFMFTTPGHPVAVGTPFFLKTFSREQRRELEVVAGQLDWRAMHEGIDCRTRSRSRCLLLVRDPVDRFVSYYLERSDRRFEREVAGNRSIEAWTAAELRRYLAGVSRRGLRFTGEETGLFCNGENLLCLDRGRTRPSALPLLRQVRRASARERLYFRYLGGPQDRLAWLLDPERGDPRLAVWRMRQCVVSLQAEDFEGHRRLLAWHFPWIHEVRPPPPPPGGGGGGGAGAPAGEGESGPGAGEALAARRGRRSREVRRSLPRFARELIARFNWRDIIVYRAARRQHREQLRRIREASGAEERWPPVVHSTEAGVQDLVGSELRDTATYRVHEGLNRYMLGLP